MFILFDSDSGSWLSEHNFLHWTNQLGRAMTFSTHNSARKYWLVVRKNFPKVSEVHIVKNTMGAV